PAAPAAPAAQAAAAPAGGSLVAIAASRWVTDIKPTLKGFARAVYSNTTMLGDRNGVLTLGVSNEPHRVKCGEHRRDVEAAIAAVVGGKVAVQLVVHGAADDHDEPVDTSGDTDNVVPMRRSAPPPPDEEIDLDELVDVPAEAVVSPLERLTQAFPGSKLVDE
ncbi:MAG: hypothetical protein Q7V88_12125, partial [Actinomycetota bacterium]|nr:hypothetical protein [Actinomycetota bacterium]